MDQPPQSIWELAYRKDESLVNPRIVRIIGLVVLGTGIFGCGEMAAYLLLRLHAGAILMPWNFIPGVDLAVNALAIIAGAFCFSFSPLGRKLLIIWAWCAIAYHALRSGFIIWEYTIHLPRQGTNYSRWQLVGSLLSSLTEFGLPVLVLLLLRRRINPVPFARTSKST